jgi:hypothetical protein
VKTCPFPPRWNAWNGEKIIASWWQRNSPPRCDPSRASGSIDRTRRITRSVVWLATDLRRPKPTSVGEGRSGCIWCCPPSLPACRPARQRLPAGESHAAGRKLRRAAFVPAKAGAGERNRTSNLRFTKPLLCRLSYASLRNCDHLSTLRQQARRGCVKIPFSRTRRRRHPGSLSTKF